MCINAIYLSKINSQGILKEISSFVTVGFATGK